MEAIYTLKSQLFDFVTNRLEEVLQSEVEQEQVESKSVGTRLPLNEYEKLNKVASALRMTKGEFLRELIIKSVDDIIREYKLDDFQSKVVEKDE